MGGRYELLRDFFGWVLKICVLSTMQVATLEASASQTKLYSFVGVGCRSMLSWDADRETRKTRIPGGSR